MENLKKKHQIWDYLQSRCCINHPCVQRSRPHLHTLFHNPVIAALPISFWCHKEVSKSPYLRVTADYLVTPWNPKLFCQIATSDPHQSCDRAAPLGEETRQTRSQETSDQCGSAALIREEPDKVWLMNIQSCLEPTLRLQITRLLNFDGEEIDFFFF